MGLMEAQIRSALVLDKGRALLFDVIANIVDRYAHTTEQSTRLYAELTSLIETAELRGRLLEAHENSLGNDRRNQEKES